ncbi:MAG: ATP-binding protein [Planctomycetota bacterium]
MPSLFVIQGRDQGTRFELEEETSSVGRVGANEVQLHDTEVSRQHAELVRSGDSFLLRDLNSSNGTYLNGKPIRESALKTGDQVQMGRTLMLFTGAQESLVESDSLVDIIGGRGDQDGSRILHAMSQSEGSELLATPAGQTQSPWLARARSNLQIMYRTALAVSHTLDIDQLLSRIMDMIFEWVDADRGCIMLKDEETGRLEPRVRRHRRGARESDADGDDRITISKTILDYVVDNREGVLSSNARDDNRWNPAQSIVRMGVREAICVPMQGRYDLVGVIYIDTSISAKQLLQQGQANKFGQEHLKLMIAIAHQAALAVEDTSYYQAMVQAERLAAVGQTIATLSHHIKNILQGVRGGSYLIELGMQDHAKAMDQGDGEPPIDAEAAGKAVSTMRKGWSIVEKNQQRISGLVMDMLTYSKEREPEPTPAELNEVAADVVELTQTRASDAGVELVWRPSDGLPTMMFDPEALHRAILNVVSNAVDACEPVAASGGEAGPSRPARVTVSTAIDDEAKRASVVVEDTGEGIAKEDIERVFTVFVSNKGGRGTGLGLPVTQKILQEHGGTVTVDSEPGVGSRFTLELPVNLPPNAAGDTGQPTGNTLVNPQVESPSSHA